MELRAKHVPQGPFNITPIFVKRAKGALVEDVEGKVLPLWRNSFPPFENNRTLALSTIILNTGSDT